MQYLAFEIDLTNGGQHISYIPADSPGHAEALVLRTAWLQHRSEPSGKYITLVGPDGHSQNIQVADIADMRIRAAR